MFGRINEGFRSSEKRELLSILELAATLRKPTITWIALSTTATVFKLYIPV